MALIEQAQRLNPDAQNALLKTLEEPGGRVCLILAADESSNLLPTLVSRCARLRLGPLSTEQIVELLTARRRSRCAAGRRLWRACPAAGQGVALALAGQPDVSLIYARLSRSLLDLISAPPRVRLAAVPALLEDGAALPAAQTAGDERRGVAGRPARRAGPAPALPSASCSASGASLARDLALAAHGASPSYASPNCSMNLRRPRPKSSRRR